MHSEGAAAAQTGGDQDILGGGIEGAGGGGSRVCISLLTNASVGQTGIRLYVENLH